MPESMRDILFNSHRAEIQELEKIGETELRYKIANGAFTGNKKLAEEWLKLQVIDIQGEPKMRIALVVLFMLCGVSVFAESQLPPSPSGVKNHGEQYPAKTNNKREKEARGSEKNPVFIKQAQPEVQGKTRDNEGKNIDNSSVFHDWPTMVTAIFTAVLAWSTIALWRSTQALARLSRDEFNATHRPKIIIHTFERTYSEESTVGVIFTYVNVGTAPASITAIESNIFFSDNIVAEDSKRVVQFDNKFLKAGEKDIYRIESGMTNLTAIIEDMKVDRGQSVQRIICRGIIKYADNQGTSRETGFCRVYDETKGWLRVENSEHEYSY